MAFGNRNAEINYQEEYGVANKEELKAKLGKVATLETENATLKSTVESQGAEVNTIKATLAELEGRVATNNNNNNNNNNGNNNNNQATIPSVTDDEDAAFATRMAPLYESNMQTRAALNEDRILRQLEAEDPYFKKLEKETRELIKNTPLQLRSHDKHGEEIIRNAYLVVKGKHATEIVNDTRAGKGEFFIEPARNSGNTGLGNNEVDPTKLTQDEEALIARMHITKEQYLKSKQSQVSMGGALRYA